MSPKSRILDHTTSAGLSITVSARRFCIPMLLSDCLWDSIVSGKADDTSFSQPFDLGNIDSQLA